jgi:hypothetical protein
VDRRALNYVIVDPNGPRFWTGADWVREYPDARPYDRLHAAKRDTEAEKPEEVAKRNLRAIRALAKQALRRIGDRT